VTGTRALLAVRLRADRWALCAWVLGTLLAFAGTAAAVAGLYTTDAQRQSYEDAIAGNPAFEAINGIPYGASTLGGIVADEWAFLGTVAIPLLVVSLVARGTRREEESGLLELVRSRGVGRTAQLAAVASTVVAALVVVAAGMWCALVASGVPGGASALYAVSYLGLGLVWLGIATVAAQLVRRARGVRVVSLAALVAAYVLRAVGDVQGSWVKWTSPLVWMQETRAFAADHRAWPVLVALGVAVTLLAVAAVLVRERDLGAGAVASRPGPVAASRLLAAPLGLAARRAAAALLTWGAVAVVVGGVFGAVAKEAASAIGSGDLGTALATGGDPADGYLALTVAVVALLGCAAVVQGVGTLREQELDGVAEVTLARPVGRIGWATGAAVSAVATAVGVLLLGGAVAGLAAAASLDEPSRVASLTGAALGYVPAVLVCGAVALALFGVLPRAAQAAWVVVAWAALVATLGDSLQLDQWARDLSPMDPLGSLPVDAYDAAAAAELVVVAAVLAVVGLAGARRRDLPA